MKYKNLMIDIETLGNTSSAAMVSIAAVAFNKTEIDNHSDIGPSVMYNIFLHDALEHGDVSASTLQWWAKEDQSLFQNMLNTGNMTTVDALIDLAVLAELHLDDNFKIWANGPDFDLKIIEDKIEKLKEYPVYKFWSPWNQRCVRTLKAIDPALAKSFINNEKHNPLQDCLTQIDQIKAINEKYNLNLIS